jgi:hypothetical protein
MARNAGMADGGWHSFGGSASASGRGAVRGEVGFEGGARGFSGFDRGGFGFRDGFGGWGCCRIGFGFGFGFGWGWGFGFGWPFWGPYWGPYAWAPYYPYYGYDPYWYSPYPAYNYYPDDSYNWSTNPPPYRPSDEDNQPASYPSKPGTPSLVVVNNSEPLTDGQQ